MDFTTSKEKGRVGLAMGIAWFAANGYTVSVPLNDTQWYDFIAEKDDMFYSVQCKATGSGRNKISLRSTGGTKGHVYDRVINHHFDFLFCVDADKHMYVIPGDVLREHGNVNSIVLRTSCSKYCNSHSFDSSKYLVSF